jgi:hypothetical protein
MFPLVSTEDHWSLHIPPCPSLCFKCIIRISLDIMNSHELWIVMDLVRDRRRFALPGSPAPGSPGSEVWRALWLPVTQSSDRATERTSMIVDARRTHPPKPTTNINRVQDGKIGCICRYYDILSCTRHISFGIIWICRMRRHTDFFTPASSLPLDFPFPCCIGCAGCPFPVRFDFTPS